MVVCFFLKLFYFIFPNSITCNAWISLFIFLMIKSFLVSTNRSRNLCFLHVILTFFFSFFLNPKRFSKLYFLCICIYVAIFITTNALWIKWFIFLLETLLSFFTFVELHSFYHLLVSLCQCLFCFINI